MFVIHNLLYMQIKKVITIKCPYCNDEETKVVDKRETSEFDVTRRRRECLDCGKRFTTYERVEGIELYIIKKDGRRELFDRQKLLRGVQKSCEKRPVASQKIEKVLNKIETKLRRFDKNEVKSSILGSLVMKELIKLDKIAYIRFASVYLDFNDLRDFERELRVVKSGVQPR